MVSYIRFFAQSSRLQSGQSPSKFQQLKPLFVENHIIYTTLQHHCFLPSFPHTVASLAFDPTSPALLYLGFRNNTIQIFDVEAKLFPDWSHSICASLPKRFTQLHDSMQGLLFDQAASASSGSQESKAVYAWGSSWLCKLDLNSGAQRVTQPRKKRGREDGKPPQTGERESGKMDGQALEVCTRYRNILCVSFLGPRELVIVERPITDVLQTLPPAYFRPKYGAA
jgi:U3 small nucleolar RNA-associated protein 4